MNAKAPLPSTFDGLCLEKALLRELLTALSHGSLALLVERHPMSPLGQPIIS